MREAENGVTRPQAKECLEHQKVEEARKHFLLEPVNNVALWTLDLKLLSSRTMRQHISLVLSHSVCIIGLVKKFV